MVFDGFGPLVKRCDGFDGSLWSISLTDFKKIKKWRNPTIFVELTYGHFDILMSQCGQMRKKWAFLGCAKIVLRLHTARTEMPDTPQTHPSASDVQEYPSDTPRHPPNIPQTPTRYLQGAREANRRQQTPTDTARHTQTTPVSVLGCLRLSLCVCWRLLLSVGALCSLKISWGCMRGVVEGIWGYLNGNFGLGGAGM